MISHALVVLLVFREEVHLLVAINGVHVHLLFKSLEFFFFPTRDVEGGIRRLREGVTPFSASCGHVEVCYWMEFRRVSGEGDGVKQ